MKSTLMAIICSGPCWVSPAFAQTGTTDPAKPVLGGPRIPDKAGRATLVSYEFTGKVRRPETTPEEAAAALIDLDPAPRAILDAVLYRRAKMLDEFVADNLDLIVKLVTAGATGDKADQALLAGEALVKLAPLSALGTLRAQVDGVLPTEQRPEFERLLKEYFDAVVAERQRPASPSGPRSADAGAPEPKKERTKARWEIILQERVECFGREIERAFKRQEAAGSILFRYLTTGVDLSKEQAEKVRDVCEAFARDTKMNATPEQQRKFFFDLAALLDTRQQTKMIRRLQGKQ